jgi:Ala-tRNA(Pro) deacylase
MLLDKIRAWLAAEGVSFREVHHEPTRTSEDSARARGEELRVGGKALLIKIDDVYRLFVLSADRKLDSAAVKQRFGARKTRFATQEELAELTGLVPGAVPPFGPPLLPFPLYVDPSVFANERIAFNAGSLTDSIVMAASDYRKVAAGEEFKFAEGRDGAL